MAKNGSGIYRAGGQLDSEGASTAAGELRNSFGVGVPAFLRRGDLGIASLRGGLHVDDSLVVPLRAHHSPDDGNRFDGGGAELGNGGMAINAAGFRRKTMAGQNGGGARNVFGAGDSGSGA